jgi:hypothetical protein
MRSGMVSYVGTQKFLIFAFFSFGSTGIWIQGVQAHYHSTTWAAPPTLNFWVFESELLNLYYDKSSKQNVNFLKESRI